eukprot:11444928-Ditylum_brightwellii.AAC.1
MDRSTPPRTFQHTLSETFLMLLNPTCWPHRNLTRTSEIQMCVNPASSDFNLSLDTSVDTLSHPYTCQFLPTSFPTNPINPDLNGIEKLSPQDLWAFCCTMAFARPQSLGLRLIGYTLADSVMTFSLPRRSLRLQFQRTT